MMSKGFNIRRFISDRDKRSTALRSQWWNQREKIRIDRSLPVFDMLKTAISFDFEPMNTLPVYKTTLKALTINTSLTSIFV